MLFEGDETKALALSGFMIECNLNVVESRERF